MEPYEWNYSTKSKQINTQNNPRKHRHSPHFETHLFSRRYRAWSEAILSCLWTRLLKVNDPSPRIMKSKVAVWRFSCQQPSNLCSVLLSRHGSVQCSFRKHILLNPWWVNGVSNSKFKLMREQGSVLGG